MAGYAPLTALRFLPSMAYRATDRPDQQMPSGTSIGSRVDQTCLKVVVGNFGSIHAKPQDRSSTLWPSATNWSRHGGGTMKAALQNYQARMRRVLDYIDR